MEIDGRRKMRAILRVLGESERPLGSTAIAAELHLLGIALKERMVRYYLGQTDELGYTENLGRAGRRITASGMSELRATLAVEKVGFVSARVDELSYRMSFDLNRGEGTVVLNVSRLRAADAEGAREQISRALDAGLGMGRLIALGGEGEVFGGQPVAFGEVAVGTVCSVTLNGVLRAAGIPVTSRFGGLLELRDGNACRFWHVIHYDGTTIDPVEIFLKGKMTSVRTAAAVGSGMIGASFREIPASALPAAAEIMERMKGIGLLGGLWLLGRPGQPLLEIPVSPGRAGLIVAAGLNPMAAVEEAGIETENLAMATLVPFDSLVPVEALGEMAAARMSLHRRICSRVERGSEKPYE